MNIHEYQAKKLLDAFDIAVGNGMAAETVQEAVDATNELGG